MNLLLIVCSVCSGAAVVGLSVLWVVETLKARRQGGFRSVLQRRYLHIVMSALYSGRGAVPRFPMLRRVGASGGGTMTEDFYFCTKEEIGRAHV